MIILVVCNYFFYIIFRGMHAIARLEMRIFTVSDVMSSLVAFVAPIIRMNLDSLR